MRHVRMLVICLVAVFAISAVTVDFTSEALATGGGKPQACNEECKKEKEKIKEEEKLKKEEEGKKAKEEREKIAREEKRKKEEEQRAKELPKVYGLFVPWCPLRDPRGLTQCLYGKTGPGAYFKAGNITVPFTKSIYLKGGDVLTEVEEKYHFTFVGSENDNETLSKTPEEVPGGLESVVDPTKLSESELARYNETIAAGKTKTTVTIELAGPTGEIYVNPFAILEGEGEAIGLPVQVKVSNPFLGKSCYIGSNSQPIRVSTTSGKSGALTGRVGELSFKAGGEVLIITNGDLVDNEYSAPAAYGCGTFNGADAAVNSKSGLPAGPGENVVNLEGELQASGAVETAAFFGLEYK